MSKALVTLSKDIKEICDPYFKQLGLDHLNYIHRDDQGNVTYLCSNQKWLDRYIKKSYPKIGAFEKNIELSQYNYILWTGLDRNDPILIDSKEMLDVEYGITLIKREEEGFGFYNLGTKSSDSSIINRYVNNLNEYEHFIQDFQDQAKNLFRSAKNLKFHINSGSIADGSKKTGYQFGSLYLTDKILRMDQFYYDLNKFYINISQKPARLDTYLTVEQVKELKKIIKKSDVGPNSINADIVDLYESIQDICSPFRRPNDSAMQQKQNLTPENYSF